MKPIEIIDIESRVLELEKPSRYIGGELNSVKKDLNKVDLKFAFAFPDVYDVGMSHLGLQIIYQILNAREDIACERVFAPWTDFEDFLRSEKLPLFTLESKAPLYSFDVLGFSLQYELSFTNILNMLELGGIELFAKDRAEDAPFVCGGGHVATNPEPVADFFDFFIVGDGEDTVIKISDAIIDSKKAGLSRQDTLKELSKIKGVYVPSLFEVTYKEDNTIEKITPLLEGYAKARSAVVEDLNLTNSPIKPVVPFLQAVHDRLAVEINRGCTRGCRFCQAGMITRPSRERTIENITEVIREGLKNTGYDEVSLMSLSTGDFAQIDPLLCSLMPTLLEKKVSVSFPSMRVGTLSKNLANEIKKVKKTGFTMAPEAGSERLRNIINKGIAEEDLLKSAEDIFTLGWKALKLYYMIGLPTETDTDLDEIIRLSREVKVVGRNSHTKLTGSKGGAPQINVSVSTFVPKPFTPFQWSPMIGLEEIKRKQSLLRGYAKKVGLGFKWHDKEISYLEGIFSRGDRRLSKLIMAAYKAGCRFDGWSEKFDFEKWMKAADDTNIDTDFYVQRERDIKEVLPWDHIDTGIEKAFLVEEYLTGLKEAQVEDCKFGKCSNCGVCDHKIIKNIVNKLPDDIAAKKPRIADELSVSPPIKVRLNYSKTGVLRYLSHLEMLRVFNRAISRANLPVRFSQGFSPSPKVSFANPLSVGMESLDEYMDIELNPVNITVNDVISRLNKTLPHGITINGGKVIALQVKSLSVMIKAQNFAVDLSKRPEGLNIDFKKFDGFLRDFLKMNEVQLKVRRKNRVKEINIRPLVGNLEFSQSTNKLNFLLKLRENFNVKPFEVVAHLLDIPIEKASLIPITKTKSII